MTVLENSNTEEEVFKSEEDLDIKQLKGNFVQILMRKGDHHIEKND